MHQMLRTIGLLVLCYAHASMAQASLLTPKTQAQQEQIEQKRANLTQDIEKAELLQDEEMLAILKSLDAYLEKQLKCYENKDEIDVDICYMTTLKQLAHQGNLIAQHQLGNVFENSYDDPNMAIFWYQKAHRNPATPESYQVEIMRDLQRLTQSGTVLSPLQTDKPTD